MRNTPKISVVTACYNAADFIEHTINSVLQQRYDNIEYIIIDGGSTDGTCAIIERYGSNIDYFVSEPDSGQYSAIQKGFSQATGDVFCWLNADDILMPWALDVVGAIFHDHPGVEWITGTPAFLDKAGHLTELYSATAAYPRDYIKNGWYDRQHGGFLQQENMFWRRSLWEKSGGLDCAYRLAADYELWCKFAQHASLIPVTVPLAAFRRLPGVQRSSLDAEAYDNEVSRARLQFQRVPILWRFLSGLGDIARGFARLIRIKKAPILTYEQSTNSWIYLESYRSISRHSLSGLFLEFARRKRKV